jgi:hypothetical protein
VRQRGEVSVAIWLAIVAVLIATAWCSAKVEPVHAADSSIGGATQTWILERPHTPLIKRFPPDQYHHLATLAGRQKCAVKIQIADLVTDPKTQCFDFDDWPSPRYGWMVVPVPKDPEYVVTVPFLANHWVRASQIKRGDVLGVNVSRRRVARP